jgi:hypothetical protein
VDGITGGRRREGGVCGHNRGHGAAVRRNTLPKHGPERRQRVRGRATAGVPSDHAVPRRSALVRRSIEHPAHVTH